MDSRVSARIPMEKRDRGDEALAAIGATTSQLIQAAYDYLIATGKLPRVSSGATLHGGHLSKAQKLHAQQVLRASTCRVPAGFFAGKTDDELLEDELRREYEALA